MLSALPLTLAHDEDDDLTYDDKMNTGDTKVRSFNSSLVIFPMDDQASVLSMYLRLMGSSIVLCT